MPVQSGKPYTCLTHQTTVIVTRVGPGELRCEGEPLVLGRGTREMEPGKTFLVSLGKRYAWPKPPPPPKEGEPAGPDLEPRTELLCTLPGDCTLSMDNDLMLELQPKVLPSAD